MDHFLICLKSAKTLNSLQMSVNGPCKHSPTNGVTSSNSTPPKRETFSTPPTRRPLTSAQFGNIQAVRFYRLVILVLEDNCSRFHAFSRSLRWDQDYLRLGSWTTSRRLISLSHSTALLAPKHRLSLLPQTTSLSWV